MGRNEVEWTDEIDGSSNEKWYAGPNGSCVSADHLLYDGIASQVLNKVYHTSTEPLGIMSVDGSVTSLVPLLDDSASFSVSREASWSADKVGVISSAMGSVIAMPALSDSSQQKNP